MKTTKIRRRFSPIGVFEQEQKRKASEQKETRIFNFPPGGDFFPRRVTPARTQRQHCSQHKKRQGETLDNHSLSSESTTVLHILLFSRSRCGAMSRRKNDTAVQNISPLCLPLAFLLLSASHAVLATFFETSEQDLTTA